VNAILAGESSAITAEPSARRLLSVPEFQRLVEVPPEAQWFSAVCQEVIPPQTFGARNAISITRFVSTASERAEHIA
jgi:hypothetical protein